MRDILKAFTDMIASVIAKVSTFITDILTKISNWGKNTLTSIKETITDWGTQISTWWEDTKNTVSTKAAELWQSLTDWANSLPKIITDKIAEMTTAGANIIDGLWSGVNGAWASFKSKLVGLANLLPDIVKKILGIASPSAVFMGIGHNMMAGLAQGILSGVQLPNMALNMVGGNMINAPMAGMYAPPSVSHSVVNNYNMSTYTNNNAEVVQQSFGLMRILAG
jgi:phage-related protein